MFGIAGVALAQTGDGVAYKELSATFGAELESLKQNSQEQQAMLDKFVSDYADDRKQMARIFESITDRLDKIDGNLRGMNQRIDNIANEK
jgi:hypothetical protein